MSLDLSLPSLSEVTPLDLSGGVTGGTQEMRIKQVSKAMEGVFASQLMAEMGKGIGGPGDAKEGGPYQDFIQQAMTQGITSGRGLGLAKVIEGYLTQHTGHPSAEPVTTPLHDGHAH